MALFEKQRKARKNFVEKIFSKEKVLENYSDQELIIKNNDENFPYLYITISAVREEVGFEKLSKLKNKKEYVEWKNKEKEKRMQIRNNKSDT